MMVPTWFHVALNRGFTWLTTAMRWFLPASRQRTGHVMAQNRLKVSIRLPWWFGAYVDTLQALHRAGFKIDAEEAAEHVMRHSVMVGPGRDRTRLGQPPKSCD